MREAVADEKCPLVDTEGHAVTAKDQRLAAALFRGPATVGFGKALPMRIPVSPCATIRLFIVGPEVGRDLQFV
jgi:hypothetical protein